MLYNKIEKKVGNLNFNLVEVNTKTKKVKCERVEKIGIEDYVIWDYKEEGGKISLYNGIYRNSKKDLQKLK